LSVNPSTNHRLWLLTTSKALSNVNWVNTHAEHTVHIEIIPDGHICMAMHVQYLGQLLA